MHDEDRNLGERAADALTRVAGSWTFIIVLGIFLAIWVALNVYMVIDRWDPYPFILLNLVLSCMAAVQAPIILMGQNLQADKDRRRGEYDYAVDKKAEREIKDIQERIAALESMLKKHYLEDIKEEMVEIKRLLNLRKNR